MNSTYDEQIVAMAIAGIAEETGTNISELRVISFKETHSSRLEQYIEENDIEYKKYQLGD